MTDQPILTAVIPAAGFGTRFLPASKAVPKELLPLGDRPVLHWLVAEAAAAGARDVVIVLAPGKEAIRDYFTADPRLDTFLAATGKTDRLRPLADLLAQVRFTFVVQPEARGLGDAVLCARDAVGRRDFLVLLGDAPIRAATPVCAQLVCRYRDHRGSIIGLREVPEDRTSRYGIVAGDRLADDFYELHTLVEKPPPGQAPSRLAVSGRYLLSHRIFDCLAHQAPGVLGEIQLTDAIVTLLADRPVYGLVYEGTRYDIGDPPGYLAAQQAWLAAE